MIVNSITVDEFEASWHSEPDHRYSYELNNGALILFGSLLGAFWTYWCITVYTSQLDWVLISLATLFAVVSIYVVYNVLRWRHFGRTSGAVCETDRLVWRHGSKLCVAEWKHLDLDGIGLLDTSLGEKKYEHYLTICDNQLYLFRPFVRMRRYENFIADVLLRLKAHGRIPKSKAKKRGKKNR